MEQASGHQSIVEKLYEIYKKQGFLREEEALDLMTAEGVSLVGINRVTDRLLALGVIFADDNLADDDEIYRAQIDYESLYDDVLVVSPGQKMLINYIRNVKPPQYREWRMLVTQMNSGNEYAFNRLFDMYLRVVVKIAHRFSNDSGFDLDDAIQEGSMGLLRGIKQYDSSKHGNIRSYIPMWIHQYLNRAIANKGSIIRLPVHAYELVQKIKIAKKTLQRRNNSKPSSSEIAALVESTEETVERLFEATQEIYSLSHMLLTEEGLIQGIISIDEEVENKMRTEQVHRAISTLKERERQVIMLRFGLIDGKERTLEEIGSIFNVTRERIRQIEVKALNKMRQPSRAILLKDFYER